APASYRIKRNPARRLRPPARHQPAGRLTFGLNMARTIAAAGPTSPPEPAGPPHQSPAYLYHPSRRSLCLLGDHFLSVMSGFFGHQVSKVVGAGPRSARKAGAGRRLEGREFRRGGVWYVMKWTFACLGGAVKGDRVEIVVDTGD